MAARENQTYLITTIVFVLLALAFLLVAILGINKATEYADLNETYQADLNYHCLLYTSPSPRDRG